MRKRYPDRVECPAVLIRFDPEDWPAATAAMAWQRWLHARADFADSHRIDHDAIPYEIHDGTWARVVASLSIAAVPEGMTS